MDVDQLYGPDGLLAQRPAGSIQLLTRTGHLEAIAWLRAHFLDDANGKADLVSTCHSQDLCEALTAMLVTLLEMGTVGDPLGFVAQMLAEADRLFGDGE